MQFLIDKHTFNHCKGVNIMTAFHAFKIHVRHDMGKSSAGCCFGIGVRAQAKGLRRSL